MAERTNPFQNESENSGFDPITDAASKMKADIEGLIEGFNMQAVVERVQEFGRANPLGLALTALTVGVAAGVLMRNARQLRSH